MRLTYADRARLVMFETLMSCRRRGLNAADTAKAIDQAYPFGTRCNWPYRAWLRERRAFFADHSLPRRGDFMTAQSRRTDLIGQLLSQ